MSDTPSGLARLQRPAIPVRPRPAPPDPAHTSEAGPRRSPLGTHHARHRCDPPAGSPSVPGHSQPDRAGPGTYQPRAPLAGNDRRKPTTVVDEHTTLTTSRPARAGRGVVAYAC